MVMQMKGHNAYCPCRMCEIKGVMIPDSHVTTYHIPLDRSRHPSVLHNPAHPAKYDPRHLPLRTHAAFLAQAHEIQNSTTQTQRKRLAKEYGINGVPILTSLSSLAFPILFGFDFMHLLWENVIKNLILLWTGDFKGLDVGAEDYELNEDV